MAYDTGLGAQLTVANLTAPVISISFDEQSRDGLSVATLATTGFDPQIPADLASAGGVTLTVQYDPEIATYPLPTDSLDADVTITWPISDTVTPNTVKAYLKGDGFVSGFSYPELAIDTVQEATVSIQFNGITGPVWSAEAKS